MFGQSGAVLGLGKARVKSGEFVQYPSHIPDVVLYIYIYIY